MPEKSNQVQNILLVLFVVLALAVLVLIAGAFQFSSSLQRTTTLAESALATTQALQTKVATAPVGAVPTARPPSTGATPPTNQIFFVGGGIGFADESGSMITKTLYVVNNWKNYESYDAFRASPTFGSSGTVYLALVESVQTPGQWQLYRSDPTTTSGQWITFTLGLRPRFDSSVRNSGAVLGGDPELLVGPAQKIVAAKDFSNPSPNLRDSLDALKNAGADLQSKTRKVLLLSDKPTAGPMTFALVVIFDPSGGAVMDPYWPRPFPYYYYYL